MRLKRIMAVVLAGMLVIVGACASTATPPPVTTPPVTTPPVTTPPVTPPPVTPPPVTPPPVTPPPVTPPPVTPPPVIPPPVTPPPVTPPPVTPPPVTPPPVTPPPVTPPPVTPPPVPPPPTTVQGPNEVWAEGGNTFLPGILTVPVGTTVVWTNKDSVVHTVVSGTGLFNGTLAVGGSSNYSYTFTKPGDYEYTCDIHSGMAGAIHVQ